MALFSILAGLISLLHVGQMAEYRYSMINQTIQLEIMVEHAEMQVLRLGEGCDVQKMTALCVSNYILKHSELKVNGEVIHFEMRDARVINEHLLITLNSKNSIGSIASVEVQHSAFYEFFEAYKNRVILNFNELQGSYMLTKGKDRISLSP